MTDEERAEVRREALLEAVTSTCEWCKKGRAYLPNTFVWHEPFTRDSGPLKCHASGIRKLLAEQSNVE